MIFKHTKTTIKPPYDPKPYKMMRGKRKIGYSREGRQEEDKDYGEGQDNQEETNGADD